MAGAVLDGRVLAAGGQLRLGQQVVWQREPRLVGDAGRRGGGAGQTEIVGAGVDEPVLPAAGQADGMPLRGGERGRVHVAAQQQSAASDDPGDDARDGAGLGVAGEVGMIGGQGVEQADRVNEMKPCRPCVLDDKGKISPRLLSAVGVGGQGLNDPAVDRLPGRRVQAGQVGVDLDGEGVWAPLRGWRGMASAGRQRGGGPGWRRGGGSAHGGGDRR